MWQDKPYARRAVTHALALQQREPDRAETLAKRNQEPDKTARTGTLELATARAEVEALRAGPYTTP